MTELESLTADIIAFRDDRNWAQFHNAKDLSLALLIEASELNELFLWKNASDVDVEKLKEELADIFNFAFLLAEKFQLDPIRIVREKLAINAAKYPIEKARNNSKKYTEL
jgi:NTP pyrophosphatase (non-canonical NTP hydrolase)